MQFSHTALHREVEPPGWFPSIAGLCVAALVSVAAFTGIHDPASYAHETASWRVQGIGQDWVDLYVAVPWLIAASVAAFRGSYRGSLLLGGAFAYTAYSYAIYAFDVHFNQLFLVYCAILGLSVYGLVALSFTFGDARPWFGERAPRRVAAGFLIASSVVFALLWLAEDLPAVIRDEPPASLVEAGLPTNGVHVLDLALVLPALFIAGILLWRRRGAGYVLSTMALGFCVLMDLNIAGIAFAMHQAGLPSELVLVAGFCVLGAFASVLLAWLLRSSTPQNLRAIRGPHDLRVHHTHGRAHPLH